MNNEWIHFKSHSGKVIHLQNNIQHYGWEDFKVPADEQEPFQMKLSPEHILAATLRIVIALNK